MDFFEMVPFFKDKLNRRERDELKRSLVPCSYKAGDIIFNYRKWPQFSYFHNFNFYDFVGDIGDKFFVVYEGAVDIKLPDPEIPSDEFEERYSEFKLLEREIAER